MQIDNKKSFFEDWARSHRVEIGKRLKKTLKEEGLTQEQAANMGILGLSDAPSISRVVNGRATLIPDNAKLFSEYTGIRIEYLLCMDDFKTREDLLNVLIPEAKRISETIKCIEHVGYHVDIGFYSIAKEDLQFAFSDLARRLDAKEVTKEEYELEIQRINNSGVFFYYDSYKHENNRPFVVAMSSLDDLVGSELCFAVIKSERETIMNKDEFLFCMDKIEHTIDFVFNEFF